MNLHLKPRFFVIIGVIVLVLALAYLYSTGVFKDWQIQLSYYNSSVGGDGASSVVIPFTILAGTEQPITVPIQVQAITNIGSVATKCTSPSTCNVTFLAPRTSKAEYANISINVGGTSTGTTKTVRIEVNPDEPESIVIGAANTNFYLSYKGVLYPANATPITAYVSDKYHNPVPNGTVIMFNATQGSLSSNYCVTYDGYCNVTYTSKKQLGKIVINASSYNVSKLQVINVTRAPIGRLTYNITKDTLEAIANTSCEYLYPFYTYSCYTTYRFSGVAVFQMKPLDLLNESMQNASVLLRDYQSFSSSCNTGVNSTCNIIYEPNYNNASSSTLILVPTVNGQNLNIITLSCSFGISCNTSS